jgi:hypothetical protein
MPDGASARLADALLAALQVMNAVLASVVAA